MENLFLSLTIKFILMFDSFLYDLLLFLLESHLSLYKNIFSLNDRVFVDFFVVGFSTRNRFHITKLDIKTGCTDLEIASARYTK